MSITTTVAKQTLFTIRSPPRTVAINACLNLNTQNHFPQQPHHQLRHYQNGQNSRKLKNILVLGSHGVLGSTIVNKFKGTYNVLGADILSSDHPDVPEKNYISLPQHGSMTDLSVLLYRGVARHLTDGKLDAVVVASGGWGGDVDSDDVPREEEEQYIKEATGVIEQMMKVNYFPVVAGSLVGQRFMNANGELLSLHVFLTFLSESFHSIAVFAATYFVIL